MRTQAEEKQSIRSADPIICSPRDDMISSRNPGTERLFGHSAEQAMNRNIGVIAPPESLAEQDPLLERLSCGKVITDSETTRTARYKRLQSAYAKRANQFKTEVLSMISHDVGASLSAILGMGHLLWEAELDPESREYLEQFRRASSNLLTRVNDLLDLTRIESDDFRLEQIDFDLRELVERTVEIMSPKVKAKRLFLRPCVSPDSPTVAGDPTRLQQILLHLLRNAVRVTAAGGIVFTVAPDASDRNRLHFAITDTGPGMPGGNIAGFLDDFTQTGNTATRRLGESGIGLRTCQRLVDRMGGQLGVRSTAGKGSTFYFDAAFAEAREDRRRSPRAVINLVGRRVLVVDANPTHRLVIADMCRQWAMETSECATARAAMAVLRMAVRDGKPFALVIVDPLLPDMDDCELMSKIRLASKEVRIVVTTSDRLAGSQSKMQHFGIFGSAIKPVRSLDLFRLLCKAVDTTADHETTPTGHSPRAY